MPSYKTTGGGKTMNLTVTVWITTGAADRFGADIVPTDARTGQRFAVRSAPGHEVIGFEDVNA
jgi:hypothetical protein